MGILMLTDIIGLSTTDILTLANISMELTISTIKVGDTETAKINHIFNDIYYHAYMRNWANVQELIDKLEGLTK